MGHNWGVPADLLYYVIGDYGKSIALALCHDVPVRVENLKDCAVAASLWSLRGQFECQRAAWSPSWAGAKLLTVCPSGVYAGSNVHARNDVPVTLSNLTRTEQTVRLQLQRDRLGPTASLSAVDALTGVPVTLSEDQIVFQLASQDWKIVLVQAL